MSHLIGRRQPASNEPNGLRLPGQYPPTALDRILSPVSLPGPPSGDPTSAVPDAYGALRLIRQPVPAALDKTFSTVRLPGALSGDSAGAGSDADGALQRFLQGMPTNLNGASPAVQQSRPTKPNWRLEGDPAGANWAMDGATRAREALLSGELYAPQAAPQLPSSNSNVDVRALLKRLRLS